MEWKTQLLASQLAVVQEFQKGFFFSSFFVWQCVSLMSFRHFVSPETSYNWYLYDINIYFLSKKYICHSREYKFPIGQSHVCNNLLQTFNIRVLQQFSKHNFEFWIVKIADQRKSNRKSNKHGRKLMLHTAPHFHQTRVIKF
jgi:hypothetical protein